MPTWLQIIVGAAALVTAVRVLWRKVLHPSLRGFAAIEEALPLLRELVVEFRDTPHAFEILDEIVGQFRTDSGSSLLDVVNRLDDASTAQRTSALVLQANVDSIKTLAEQDRAQLARLEVVLNRLSASAERIEDTAAVAATVAYDLTAAQDRVDAVKPQPQEGTPK